jgi:hypothetical protein
MAGSFFAITRARPGTKRSQWHVKGNPSRAPARRRANLCITLEYGARTVSKTTTSKTQRIEPQTRTDEDKAKKDDKKLDPKIEILEKRIAPNSFPD